MVYFKLKLKNLITKNSDFNYPYFFFFNFFFNYFLLRLKDNDDQMPTFQPPVSRSNVINRVTQEQSKWKRQVQEQRRTVYDKHVLLN